MSLEEGVGATELQLQGLYLWLDNQRNFLSQTRISPNTSSDFSVPGNIQAKGLAQGFYRSHFFIERGGIEPNDIWIFSPKSMTMPLFNFCVFYLIIKNLGGLVEFSGFQPGSRCHFPLVRRVSNTK